ncbi:MAG: hypothetical protein FJX60_17420 [Alphaproteobacteria bacterium]|nr:hypothetical protein [Alphaproteobacteria bacterium]
MKCCVCDAPAVASFGVEPGAASRYPEAKRTYYAYGDRDTLLTFCSSHFESAALSWPGLIGNPVLPVHREAQAGWAAIERVRKLLRDPAVRLKVMLLWRQASRRWGLSAPEARKRARRYPVTRRRIELIRHLTAVQKAAP